MMTILDNIRGYDSPGDRKRAIAALRNHGFNYFVCYRDTQSENALLWAKADWVTKERGPGGVYVDW